MESNWIKVEERLPTIGGWYNVRTQSGGETIVPLSRTTEGKLVWVVPNESEIIEWLHISIKP